MRSVGGVLDAWPVLRQTCRYLPSCRTSLPCDWYQIILLGDRDTCVNNLPKVAKRPEVELATSRVAPYHYTARPISKAKVILA